mgnify:CR=1 FL=1
MPKKLRLLLKRLWRREYGVDGLKAEDLEPEAMTGKETILGYDNNRQEVVELSAVMDEANKAWSQYTPQGSISLTITNPEALSRFAVGAALKGGQRS